MKYNREFIHSKLEKIKDPVQKNMLQDVLQDVFHQIMDYTEESFQTIERRMEEEVVDTNETYYLYTGVCQKEQIEHIGRSLRVMPEYPIEPAIRVLGTVFLSCDYNVILSVLNQRIKAKAETENQTYQIDVTLNYSMKYLGRIRWLYQQFLNNKKVWHTIHCPYLFKFLDIVDIDNKIPKEEPIHQVILDLPGLEADLHTDMVLVWNIDEFSMKTESYKVPGEGMILFESEVQLPEEKNGYLVYFEEPENFYTILSKEILKIRTEKRGYDSIRFINVLHYDKEKELGILKYPIHSNQRILGFLDKQAERQLRMKCTIGEIKRILMTYQAYGPFTLETVVFDDEEENQGIDYNYFMPFHSFLEKRKRVTFVFIKEGMKEFTDIETMSFFVSEIQLYFEEYRCIGKLLYQKK